MPTTKHEMKVAGIARNLKDKTGRDLDEWVALVKREGPKDRKAQIAWLKNVHSLGHFQAKLVVEANS
jgi:hypothetical protein